MLLAADRLQVAGEVPPRAGDSLRHALIAGVIKGTSFDRGEMPAIEPSRVAAKYWELYSERKELRTTLR